MNTLHWTCVSGLEWPAKIEKHKTYIYIYLFTQIYIYIYIYVYIKIPAFLPQFEDQLDELTHLAFPNAGAFKSFALGEPVVALVLRFSPSGGLFAGHVT